MSGELVEMYQEPSTPTIAHSIAAIVFSSHLMGLSWPKAYEFAMAFLRARGRFTSALDEERALASTRAHLQHGWFVEMKISEAYQIVRSKPEFANLTPEQAASRLLEGESALKVRGYFEVVQVLRQALEERTQPQT